MSKHTPGPWSSDPRYESEVNAPNGLTIASCWHKYADGEKVTITGVNPVSLDESSANARLIATAPELLEALLMIAPDMRYLAKVSRKAAEFSKAIDSVIAKATGETT